MTMPDTMNDAELREAAARILEFEEGSDLSGARLWCGPDGFSIYPYEWDPLTRWDHAGLILEKMLADGWVISIYGGKDLMTVGFRPSAWGSSADKESHSTETPTPRAITVAAVVAMEAGKDKGEKAVGE